MSEFNHMPYEVVDIGFGLARIKQEGTPAHPDDVFIHCGCEKCEIKWQKQLKAYNDFHNKESK